MRFTKLRLVGANSIDLPIEGVETAGVFLLKSADGLGPPEVEVRISDTAGEGGVYQGRRARNRQVVVLIGLQPEWDLGQTAEELRTLLYGLLTPKFGQMVGLEIHDETGQLAFARGHISRFEAAIFSEDPAVQVTLDCDHPYLKAPATKVQVPVETVSGTQTFLDISNEGTAPSGFTMGITFTAATPGLVTLSDEASDGERISISTPGGFAAGDSLIIDTRQTQRGLWKVKAGQTAQISILNDLVVETSVWMQLYGGTNRLRLNSVDFDWYAPVMFAHLPTYWGV